MIEFEAECVNDVCLLVWGHRVPECLGLGKMFGELHRVKSLLHGYDFLRVLVVCSFGVLGGGDQVVAVRVVVDLALLDGVPSC